MVLIRYGANETAMVPLTDLPEFDGVALQCTSSDGCTLKNVWSGAVSLLPSSGLRVELRPFASAFYIVSTSSVDSVAT